VASPGRSGLQASAPYQVSVDRRQRQRGPLADGGGGDQGQAVDLVFGGDLVDRLRIQGAAEQQEAARLLIRQQRVTLGDREGGEGHGEQLIADLDDAGGGKPARAAVPCARSRSTAAGRRPAGFMMSRAPASPSMKVKV